MICFMLDDICSGLYPFMIMILTSNSTPDQIDELDSSYIREGRVNMFCEFTTKYFE
jgi:hypothetical protein